MSANNLKFYIDGAWVDPVEPRTLNVIDPATEEPCGQISLGSAADVDKAVAAARAAFASYSETSREERLDLLNRIIEIYKSRIDDLGEAISHEMGAPLGFARKVQAPSGLAHIKTAARVLQNYEFEEVNGSTLMRREPIGVVGMITPWNWPQNQITCKVAPALAAGCTMVLKPSEIAPLDAIIFAEILDEAGVPAGVFNLVNGDGPTVGEAMSAHPDIDMMSFTGSTRGGIAVARGAADTVKRVTQELGGKSANILLDDVDIARAVKGGVFGCAGNTGQSCNAPTRMLVPMDRMAEAIEAAQAAAGKIAVGDPRDPATTMGPLSSGIQFDKVQALIEKGVEEGAELVAGGPGRPEGLDKGYYVRPTVFANVTNDNGNGARARRFSARFSRSSATRTRTKPSPSPTIRPTACPATIHLGVLAREQPERFHIPMQLLSAFEPPAAKSKARAIGASKRGRSQTDSNKGRKFGGEDPSGAGDLQGSDAGGRTCSKPTTHVAARTCAHGHDVVHFSYQRRDGAKMTGADMSGGGKFSKCRGRWAIKS